MNNLFVSIELAIMAKEKGFDEGCLRFYFKEERPTFVEQNTLGKYSYKLIIGRSYVLNSPELVKNNVTFAPLHQQLIDWFREKHGIYVNADLLPNVTKYKGTFVPLSFIPKKYKNFESYAKDREKYSTIDSYDDYYEALNKALEEAFKLIV